MRKKQIVMIAFIALIAIGAAQAQAQMRGGGGKPYPGCACGGAFWKDPQLVTELQLTESQIKELDALQLKHRREMIDLRAAMEKAHLDMQEAMQAQPLNVNAAKEAAEKITQTECQIMNLNIDHQAAIQRLLNKEQSEKLKLVAPRGLKHHFHQNRGRRGQNQ